MHSSAEMALETVEVEWPVDGVALARLNRPDRMNAMTNTMFSELETLARTLNNDDDV